MPANDNHRPRTTAEWVEEIATLGLGGFYTAAFFIIIDYAI